MKTEPTDAEINEAMRRENQAIVGHRLVSMMVNAINISKLTDEQLADAIMREIWANTKIDTREHAVLAEAIDRLRNKAAEAVYRVVKGEK